MSIVVLGVNYHTSPVTLLEKVMIPVPAMSEALRALSSHSDIREVVVLSTCNRTEVYAVAERFHGAHADILEFLCATSGLSADEITPHLYSQFDDDAVVQERSSLFTTSSAVSPTRYLPHQRHSTHKTSVCVRGVYV